MPFRFNAPDTDALIDDTLHGAKAIGDYIGAEEHQTFYLLVNKRIPAQKLGSSWIASKRVLKYFYGRLGMGVPAEQILRELTYGSVPLESPELTAEPVEKTEPLPAGKARRHRQSGVAAGAG